MSFANAGGGVGGVERSERLLRLAKRGLCVICPLYACVKGCSEALGNLTAKAAYQKGGMVAAEINGILAAEFCQDLLAPVVEAYEDEKARILG